jgi:hypothetical protein
MTEHSMCHPGRPRAHHGDGQPKEKRKEYRFKRNYTALVTIEEKKLSILNPPYPLTLEQF